MARTKGEEAFVDQFTRRLLVGWANTCVLVGELPASWLDEHQPYSSYALEKGWVSKAAPYRILAKGWTTAAAFLKR